MNEKVVGDTSGLWNKRRSDISTEVIRQPKFVPDPQSIRLEGHNYQRFLVYLPPEEFLTSAYSQEFHTHKPKDERDFARSSKEVQSILANRMESSKPITAPFLILEGIGEDDVGYDRSVKAPYPVKIGFVRVTGHEGRNRSLIAIQKGIKEIPVVIEVVGLKNWSEYKRIRYDKESMNRVLRSAGIRNYRIALENEEQ